MLQSRFLIPAAVLLVVCAVGSALTSHSHGAANVVSNAFFFTLVLLVLTFLVAAAAAGISRLRARR